MSNQDDGMSAKVGVGDLDVIDNGYIISHDLSPISLTIDNLSLEFRFEFDGSKTRIDTDVVSEKELRLTLHNHGGGVVMGGTSPQIGPQEPMSIAQTNDRELLLLYRVKTEYIDGDPSAVSLFYNFYSRNEIGDSELEDEYVGE